MSYLALYRQFRPKTFDEVIGQDHIIKTLTAQVKSGRISHAYLFSGSRGTGKTSTAKIFARAINCTGDLGKSIPCGVCPSCAQKESADIIEIDGASSNRVDAIRDLIENVKYPPMTGKYKVYIIDEVHMLSPSSYNALLLTLEEPPKFVVFILATTEPHKIPPTIQSRCMRFDFRLLPTDLIAGIVKDVYKKSGVTADEDAINYIAKCGQGSVRDALSIADKCIGAGEGKITYNDVLKITGASEPGAIKGLAQAILNNDPSAIFFEIDNLIKQGKSVSLLARDLTAYFRDLGVAKTTPNPGVILDIPADGVKELVETAKNFDINKIIYCIDVLGSIDRELRYGLAPRIVLENACVKAARLISEGDMTAVLAKISQLEKALSSGTVAAKQQPQKEKTKLKEQPPIKEELAPKPPVQEQFPAEPAASEEFMPGPPVKDNFIAEPEILTETSEEAPPEPEPAITKQADKQDKKEQDLSLVKKHTVIANDTTGELWEEAAEQIGRAEKVTAELLKALDARGEIMLKIALTDSFLGSRIRGDKIVFFVNDENYFKLLKKPENIKRLEEFLDGLKFDCVLAEKKKESEKQIIEKLSEFAGSKLEIINKKD